MAATNEEAVCTDHRDCHPNPHIIHHLRILTIPLAGQVGGQPLLRIPSLATRNAIHRVNHRRKILPHFQTVLEILILLLLLMLFKNFCKFLLLVGSSVRVRNTHIKYGRSATFPEPMAAGIPLFISGGRWMRSICGRS
jgi:hypothetical protein